MNSKSEFCAPPIKRITLTDAHTNHTTTSSQLWCSKLISFAAEEGPAVSGTCTVFNCNKCDFLSTPINV